jgi:hypothetical protein
MLPCRGVREEHWPCFGRGVAFPASYWYTTGHCRCLESTIVYDITREARSVAHWTQRQKCANNAYPLAD